jgi:DNA (cytosine-5)-methyltransferase 1
MKSKTDTIFAADLYAGGGGTSTGLALACRSLGKKVELLAVNHWPVAVRTHAANHPWARHICKNVEDVVPRQAVPGGHLDILVASPSCVFHSRAAGGRPRKEQDRASPWHVLRWIEELEVDSMLVENVPEFASWCRLDAKGYPVKAERGQIFQSWLSAIRSFGYAVDTRILNSADFGAPTSRSRLFIAAKKGHTTISWPKPTHSKNGIGKRRWRPARDVIDWSIKGESIFNRKRPLSPRTISRIIEGLKRFGGRELVPFIVLMEHGGGVRNIQDPLPTITTAKGGSMALAEPESFILSQASGGAPRSVKDPMATITAKGAHALVEPFILSRGSNGAPKSVEEPIPSILTAGKHALIIPFFGERKGQRPRVQKVDDPLAAVTSHGAGGLAEAFIVEYHDGKASDKRVSSVNSPLKTIDTANRFALAQPFVLPVRGFFGKNTPKSVDEPLGTITQRGYGGVVQPLLVDTPNDGIRPFIAQYNGNSGAQSIDEPLPTVPTKDRFGLVQPEINGKYLDIRFRMLQPHELALAMGFGRDYVFRGTKTETVKMIGNAVEVRTAYRLCKSLLSS